MSGMMVAVVLLGRSIAIGGMGLREDSERRKVMSKNFGSVVSGNVFALCGSGRCFCGL